MDDKRSVTTIKSILFCIVISIVTLVIFIIVVLGIRTQEFPESRELFTLYEYSNVTFVVVFDREPPVVQIVSPDGNKVDMENVRHRHGSNFIQYFLPSSMPGTWLLAYNPLSNINITSPYFVYTEHIMIMDFEAHWFADEHGNIPVSFWVSADEHGDFTYTLYSVFTAQDNSIEEKILLTQGEDFLNNRIELYVNISDLLDRGGFMLRLTVYYGEIQDTSWFDLRN